MTTGWRDYKLGDLLEIKHGYGFKGEFFSDNGDYVLLTPGNFLEAGGLKLKGEKEKFYVGKIPDGFILQKGDLIVAMTDLLQEAPILGSPAFVPQSDRFLHNQRLGKVINIRRDIIAPEFLFYLFNTATVRAQIKGSASGATVRHTSPSRIYEVEVIIPPPAIQRRIARALSAYDEQMENCQRRIRVLDEMARTLFREWFVHLRFPGYETVSTVDSSVGPIPQSWQVKTVAELVKRLPVGKKFDQKTVNRIGAVPVLDQGKSGVIGYHDNEPGVEASESAPVVVFANHTCYQRLIHFPFSAIQNVLPFVPSAAFPRNIYWLYWATNGLVVFNDYKGHWPEFAAKTLGVPPSDICERFGCFAAPLARQTLRLERTIANLRRTRDLLLPRLLSGQVSLDVSAVEDVVEPTTRAQPLSQTDFAIEGPALRTAEEAPPWRVERAGHGLPFPAEPADESPVPIDQIDRTEVLQVIRQVFSEGPPRERDAAIRDVARVLGYRRTGPRIQEILRTDLLTAVRRCILENQNGALSLCARSITDYDRDFLKQQFLAAIGRTWIDRNTAIREFCRWLGFARTGPIIENTARSLINGLLREGRLEADGTELIRRSIP